MVRLLSVICIILYSCGLGAQSYRDYVRMALASLEKDSLETAEGQLREALRLEPNLQSNAILYQYLGRIQERRGQTGEALKSYGQGLDVAPQTESLLLDRASLYMRLKNEDKALADYNAVLLKNADHVEALFFRAYIYVQKRQYRQGREDYEHLIRLEPEHEQARLGLALLNDKDRRPREAMEQMNLLVQMYPTHANLYVVRAGMEADRKLYEMALADYAHAIELEPENPDFYLLRGHFYQKIKKKKEAKADFQTALTFGADPRDVP